MVDDSQEIAKLKAQIAKLDARVEELSSVLSRRMNTSMGMDQLLKQHLNLHDADLAQAFERIFNLEVKVFPNLVRDMDQLYRVIGETPDKKPNPLDQRKK
jgi:hypothetical protein